MYGKFIKIYNQINFSALTDSNNSSVALEGNDCIDWVENCIDELGEGPDTIQEIEGSCDEVLG